MGTHPIFESDFDCLTVLVGIVKCNVLEENVFIFCKVCGENITTLDHLVNIKSSEAVGRRNEILATSQRILLQEFINPANVPFEVATVDAADVLLVGDRVASDSFFPGYDWTIIVCPKCKRHVGWAFTDHQKPKNSDPDFYGLIWSKIFLEVLGQTVVQKSWNS